MDSLPISYTGTVNVWTSEGIVNSGVQQAWDDLQLVPSYVERFKNAALYEKVSSTRFPHNERCRKCEYIVCLCEE